MNFYWFVETIKWKKYLMITYSYIKIIGMITNVGS
jgi:hypothetical protein